ncbi:hypothetical protein D8Y22_14690 [Salinadaptatus halalkaliphilus]|uniref:Uncharacterized protein n=1 Tax=Salinadaptatus halalkaliphilus TaxID=2419781 RepID=A0A4S3TMB5_9EURY|nr:hypothetical protein [Salinadaptatus halalkaliphilus]THE64155.1 hypothetical protein D8Y22_14690 [Salinadaptatus halalkaliphilus]
MQLEQRSGTSTADWSGTVPTAFDARVLGLVVVTAGLAASLNVPYGGIAFALAAFVVLAGLGILSHVLGERQLRRLADRLIEHWTDAGGQIEAVTKSSNGMRTEWTVQTPDGTVTVGGVALAPISRLSVEWQGVGDSVAASDAEREIDSLAADLYEEIFVIGTATQQS